MIRRLRLVVVAVALAIVAGGFPAAASAQMDPDPATDVANRTRILEGLAGYEMNPTGGNSWSRQPVQTFRLPAMTTSTNAGAHVAVQAELGAVRAATGVRPSLTAVLSRLGTTLTRSGANPWVFAGTLALSIGGETVLRSLLGGGPAEEDLLAKPCQAGSWVFHNTGSYVIGIYPPISQWETVPAPNPIPSPRYYWRVCNSRTTMVLHADSGFMGDLEDNVQVSWSAYYPTAPEFAHDEALLASGTYDGDPFTATFHRYYVTPAELASRYNIHEGGEAESCSGTCPVHTVPPPDSVWNSYLTEIQKPENVDARRFINHVIDPDNYPDPTSDERGVPNCVGGSYADCVTLLEGAGLVPVKTTLTAAEADLEKPAGVVVETIPGAGTTVLPGTEVDVRVNPDPMPVVVPAPLANELGQDYASRVTQMGLVATVEVIGSPDADHGPDAVVTVQPAAGTRVSPGSGVTVRVNPSTAPSPGGATGHETNCGITPPSANLDTSPITNANLGDRLPLAVIPWLSSSTAGLAGTGEAFDASFSVWGYEVSAAEPLSEFSTPIGWFRVVLIFLLWIGVAWFIYGRTIGKGT